MKFEQLLSSYKLFISEINNLLGVNNFYGSISYEENVKFFIEGDVLTMFDEDGDEYEYIVSSIGARSEEFIFANKEKWFIVMAYPSDMNWDDAEIFILKEENRID